MNPEHQYCNCGRVWQPKLHHKIWMLVFGEYTHTCNCGCRMKFHLIHHTVKIESENVDKKELWKRG